MRAGKAGKRFEHFGSRIADAHIRHVHNCMPVAAELTNLLGIDLQKKIGPVTGA